MFGGQHFFFKCFRNGCLVATSVFHGVPLHSSFRAEGCIVGTADCSRSSSRSPHRTQSAAGSSFLSCDHELRWNCCCDQKWRDLSCCCYLMLPPSTLHASYFGRIFSFRATQHHPTAWTVVQRSRWPRNSLRDRKAHHWWSSELIDDQWSRHFLPNAGYRWN